MKMTHDLSYYRTIQGLNGVTSKKAADIRLIKAEVDRDFENTIDCESVTINGSNSVLLITKTDKEDIKRVVARPDSDVYLGDIVGWMSSYWLLDKIDSDIRITTRGKMIRCNVTMRWIDEDDNTFAYPGVCEDASKGVDGIVYTDLMHTGDFQIKVKIRLDENSVKINRDRRFLFDALDYVPQLDSIGMHPSAFKVTRRNVLTGARGEHGYVELTLVECSYSDNDNSDLMIADYYKTGDLYELTISNADEQLVIADESTYALSVTATLNGASLSASAISYASNDETVATVSSLGVISAVSIGTCTIIVKAGNVSYNINLSVEEASEVAEIRVYVDNDEYIIPYGQSKRVDYAAYLNGSEISSAFMVEITGFPTVAYIDSDGSGYVVIVALDDESLIGSSFTLNISSDILGTSISQVFTIAGWF